MTLTHSLTHSDKATLWIIELLTLQLKTVYGIITNNRTEQNQQNSVRWSISSLVFFKDILLSQTKLVLHYIILFSRDICNPFFGRRITSVIRGISEAFKFVLKLYFLNTEEINTFSSIIANLQRKNK